MSDSDAPENGPLIQAAPLIASAAMVGAGTLIAFAGLAIGCGYLVAVTRRWVKEMEVPPSELARLKWAQARAAVSAGASAWQNGTRTDVTSDS
jgi:hypothetical protein